MSGRNAMANKKVKLGIITKFGTRKCFYTCVSFGSQGWGGGGGLPSMHHWSHVRGGGLHPRGDLHPGEGWSVSEGRGLHLDGGGLQPGGAGVFFQVRGSASGGEVVCIGGGGKTPLQGYTGYYGIRPTSGWYASYWGAFLF